MKTNRGFTILELFIIMIVVGILAFIAIPLFKTVQGSYNVRTAADQLASELQTARLLAVSRNASFQMVFNSTKGSYQVIDPDDSAAPPRSAKTLPAGVSFTQVPAQLTFYARGNSPTGTVQLGNSTYTLRVTLTSSGKVKVEKGY